MQQPPLNIGKQKDAIKLTDGKQRASNWRKFITKLFGNDGTNIPHGVFIPMTDIIELSKYRQEVQQITIPPSTVAQRIYVVGVRSYYSFLSAEIPSIPIQATTYPIEAMLVPVYQTNFREPGSPGEYDYNKDFPTYDLIVPVPSVNDSSVPGDAGAYSIYDITQPCPKLCDANSELF